MLALYFPILLYAVSTFDVSDEAYVVKEYEGVAVGDQTVVLGQPYTARTFLSARELTTGEDENQSVRPELVPEGDLKARGDSALVMNTDDLLNPGEDQRQVKYQAHYQVQQIGGNTEQFPVRGSFTVRRPEIVAKTETAQALYRHTLNRIRLSVPGLPDQSLRIAGPDGSVSGTTLVTSPGGDRVTARVYLQRSGTDDLLLGEREFAVIDPPRPEIRVTGPQGEVSSGSSLNRRRAVLEFDVIPDSEFQARYAEDAQYEAGSATVFVRRGQTASEKIGDFDLGPDGRLVLTQDLRDAEPGDQIIVRLQNVVRINHRGQRIEVSLEESSRTFGFVLS